MADLDRNHALPEDLLWRQSRLPKGHPLPAGSQYLANYNKRSISVFGRFLLNDSPTSLGVEI